jgi:hypothetical protein
MSTPTTETKEAKRPKDMTLEELRGVPIVGYENGFPKMVKGGGLRGDDIVWCEVDGRVWMLHFGEQGWYRKRP